MQTTIMILIAAAMIITTIVNFAKPAYEQFVWKYAVTINIALSFILWVCAAFAVRPYLEFELANGALILLWLALGTWANIFYDIWKLVQNLGSTKHTETVEEKPSAIWYDLSPNEWENAED
jgi:hypothetical protein